MVVFHVNLRQINIHYKYNLCEWLTVLDNGRPQHHLKDVLLISHNMKIMTMIMMLLMMRMMMEVAITVMIKTKMV